MREVPLTGKYGVGRAALVDEQDFDAVSQFRWYGQVHFFRGKVRSVYALTGYYSRRADGTRVRAVRMHVLLCPVPDGMTVDHINGNTLDNRRENLRPATQLQQLWNTARRRTTNGKLKASAYKGVSLLKDRPRPWRARIRLHGREIPLGYFRTEVEAALAYDVAAMKYFGEFARPNNPCSTEIKAVRYLPLR